MPEGERREALAPFFGLCAAAALVVTLGNFHAHTADSLIPVLVSVMRWTPFYWGQNRYGMLVPLLALPFHDPFWHLVVQVGLLAFAGFAAVFLMSRYLFQNPGSAIIACVAVSTLLLLAPPHVRFEDLGTPQPYGVSLALAFAGLLLMESDVQRTARVRRIVAWSLIFLAHWVNASTGLAVIPLILVRRWLERDRPAPTEGSSGAAGRLARWWRSREGQALAPLSAGLVFGYVLLRVFPGGTLLNPASPRTWPSGWHALAINSWNSLEPGRWPIALGVEGLIGVLALALPWVRKNDREAPRTSISLICGATVYAFLVGTMSWVRNNSYPYRYVLPSLLFLALAGAGLAVGPVCSAASERVRRVLGVTGAAAVFLSALSAYGLPSVDGARRQIFGNLSPVAADVLASRATFVAGDYWTVWPAVFQANGVLYERREARRVFGVSVRAWPTVPLWGSVPRDEALVAIPRDDSEARRQLEEFRFPALEWVEDRRATSLSRLAPGASWPPGPPLDGAP